MRIACGALVLGLSILSACKAPDILLSDSTAVTARSDDYARLWQACRAVLARQFEIVQENERDGVISARGRASPAVGNTSADPTDNRTFTTEITLALLPKGGAYEVRVRAVTRSDPGPDFDVIRDSGKPQTKESLDFNALGTGVNRDRPLEELLQAQIQTELNYAPTPPKPKKD